MKLLTTKKLLAILLVLLVTNVAIIIYFVYFYHTRTTFLQHQRYVNQIVGIISAIQDAPTAHQQERLAALTHHHLQLGIGPAPSATKRWRFEHTHSLKEIREILLRRHGYYHQELALSYELDSHHWLNIHLDGMADRQYQIMSKPVFAIGLFVILQIGIMLALLAYVTAVQRFNAPLREIKQTATRLGIDLHAKEIPVYGPHIVQEAISALNIMQARIKQLLTERVATLASLSHDIKTPLSRLKLILQLHADEAMQRSTLQEIEDIEFLLKKSLSYAQQEFSNEASKRLDIVVLVATVCDQFIDSGHAVAYTSNTDHYTIEGQPNNLRRVFNNIIDNALKYGQKADVLIQADPRGIEISIEDNGPGIPQAELDKVFAPFYRSTLSRKQHISGTGLGLSVVKAACAANHIDIVLTNRQPRGLHVQLKFNKT
ncbi:MAG: hypothetical protein Tsb005_21030 [Gammaproteobacteria bacterium]